MNQALLPGTQVLARGLQWEVVHVEPAGGQQRYRLRVSEGDLRGLEFDFLHPLESIEPLPSELAPTRAGRLRQWRLYHQAFLLEQALGPSALLAAQPGRLDIAPYQLVPVMRALQTSRPRLLIADGVGLGKTIEAGLVLAELIARRRAHRILIVSPAGPLLTQWEREMRLRFGLRFERIQNWGALQELRKSLVLGSNPFDHAALCLTSMEFARQEKVLQDLERTTWDVVIIDEAHHTARLGGISTGEEKRLRRLAEVLARQADGLLLLTATPHDGYDPHFASIVELLDPSLLDGRGALRGDKYRRHVIRRLKSHIKDPVTGEPLFKKREVQPSAVEFSRESHPRFAEFQEALLALVAPRLRAAVRRRRYGEVLAFVALLKRSVSTVTACRNTLRVIADRYEEMARAGDEAQETRRQRLRTLRDYRRRLERFGALSFEEEQDQAALEAEDMAAEIFSAGADELIEKLDETRREVRREGDRQKRVADTHKALVELADLAEIAIAEDPKLEAVVREISVIREAEPGANILIYTEYADSQAKVVEYLGKAIEAGNLTGEVMAISGPDPEKARIRMTERFALEDNLFLVSTDATAEGLNLHQRCHHLLHVELPYNPNRLEQRNGRIDRYGQKEIPKVRYLYLAGTFEERLLLRLIAKYERQRARLTFVPNTLGHFANEEAATTVRLLEGLADEELTLFKRPPTEVQFVEEEQDETGSEAYQELLAEIDRTMAGFEKAAKTSAWLGDAGLGADPKLIEQATTARTAGIEQSAVDLMGFVCEAVESEAASAEAVQNLTDGSIALTLPASWTFGLDDLPGWDPESRTLRLTRNAAQLRDDEDRSLGYLGRAHPIVRRALDRVRNIQFGGGAAGRGAGHLERRVSAVRSDSGSPELLFTFLGTVQSGGGREFERVVAVRVGKHSEPVAMTEPQAWEPITDPERQVPTKDVWDTYFQSWGMELLPAAREAARQAFDILAQDFLTQQRVELAIETEELESWLRARAEALCGPVQAIQEGLFDNEQADVPVWKTTSNPVERLAAFATDGVNSPARRREADGVLSLHRTRTRDLEQRMAVEIAEPATLGLLMLVPNDGVPPGKRRA